MASVPPWSKALCRGDQPATRFSTRVLRSSSTTEAFIHFLTSKELVGTTSPRSQMSDHTFAAIRLEQLVWIENSRLTLPSGRLRRHRP